MQRRCLNLQYSFCLCVRLAISDPNMSQCEPRPSLSILVMAVTCKNSCNDLNKVGHFGHSLQGSLCQTCALPPCADSRCGDPRTAVQTATFQPITAMSGSFTCWLQVLLIAKYSPHLLAPVFQVFPQSVAKPMLRANHSISLQAKDGG